MRILPVTGPRCRSRTEGSTWGDGGADDRFGRVGGVDAGQVLRDGAEVRGGRTLCLDLPPDLPPDLPGAARSPPSIATV